MIDLFSADGLAAITGLSRVRALYAFDFDGTLAPIVERPDEAYARPSTVALLSRFGALAPTAIVTGRSVDDIRQRLEFTPLHLVGNHGAEGLPDGLHRSLADSVSSHGGDAAHREVVLRWLDRWPLIAKGKSLGDTIVVEPKSYSLSIHYRLADDHEAARVAIADAIAELEPAPRVIGGKCVFNLLPVGAPDKGTALRALVRFEHCDAAFFIGDDLTDEAAFEAAPPSWVTVRVGRVDDSAARFYVAEQSDIDHCLERLIANVEASA